MSESKGVAIVTGASAGESPLKPSDQADSRCTVRVYERSRAHFAAHSFSGIGKVSAIALGKDGWTVVVTARDEAKLKDTASQIEKSHVIAGDLVS